MEGPLNVDLASTNFELPIDCHGSYVTETALAAMGYRPYGTKNKRIRKKMREARIAEAEDFFKTDLSGQGTALAAKTSRKVAKRKEASQTEMRQFKKKSFLRQRRQNTNHGLIMKFLNSLILGSYQQRTL
jgi:hypothetical protein